MIFRKPKIGGFWRDGEHIEQLEAVDALEAVVETYNRATGPLARLSAFREGVKFALETLGHQVEEHFDGTITLAVVG